MFTIIRYGTYTAGTVVNEISALHVLIKLSLIKNGSYREVLGGIGQAVEFGFVTGKLLSQTFHNYPSNNHNQTNHIRYTIQPKQLPGPRAKDQKKMIKNDQKILVFHNDTL